MSNRSFKKMLKRRGPNMEPCGTPIIVCIHELKIDSSFIPWCQFERWLLISLRLSWSKPSVYSLTIIKSLGRQSNALGRSISIVPATPDLSEQFCQLNKSSDEACCVLYLEQNLDQWGESFVLKNEFSCLYNLFS